MSIALAEMIVGCLALYAAIGAGVGLMTAAGGAGRFDPEARGMPIQARFLIFWGAAGLWPLVLVKLIAGSPKDEQSPEAQP